MGSSRSLFRPFTCSERTFSREISLRKAAGRKSPARECSLYLLGSVRCSTSGRLDYLQPCYRTDMDRMAAWSVEGQGNLQLASVLCPFVITGDPFALRFLTLQGNPQGDESPWPEEVCTSASRPVHRHHPFAPLLGNSKASRLSRWRRSSVAAVCKSCSGLD